MYRTIFVLAMLFASFFIISVNGQDDANEISLDSVFSDKVQVSLLTFGAANEPHSVWGHTAIRIKDEEQRFDMVYNYGRFDFDAPNFLFKFLRGKLDYSLGVDEYYKVYRYYNYFKRGMYEQVLSLSYSEKVKLYKLLEENYKEENRYYKYDFFFDNCSTRPLQIIEKSIDGKLMLQKSKPLFTYRQLLDNQITSEHQWMDFGIDLIIGSKADQLPSLRQSTFLPNQLENVFAKAKISVKPSLNEMKSNKTVIKKLVQKEYPIFEFESTAYKLPKVLLPMWIFTLFFMLEIILFIFSYKKAKILFKWYDKTWFFLAFIAGLLITFLWFFTDHLATKENWNYLWLNPLFIFVFLKYGTFKDFFIYTITILLFITLAGFSFIPQQFHPAIIPILGLLLLKVVKYGVLRKYFGDKLLAKVE